MEFLSSVFSSPSIVGYLISYLPISLLILILFFFVYALLTKKIDPIKHVLLVYWVVVNFLGVLSICDFFCYFSMEKVVSFLLYITFVIVPGALFIVKSFKKQFYGKWWTILIYFVLIIYPYLLNNAAQSMLCGCSKSF